MWLTSRLILYLLVAVATATPMSAAPLNATVKVLPKPSGPVPADCYEGLAPAPPPIQTAEAMPVSVSMEAPPRKDLRSILRETQSFAEAGRRDDFTDALARLKKMLTTYPAGGERNAVSDVVRVYDDLARLWTYEFESPSGGFFDPSSEPARMISAYPEYGRYIATQTITAGGVTIYPTRETREFLVQQAAKRIARVGGVDTSVSPTRTATTVAPSPAPPMPAQARTPAPAAMSGQVKPATAAVTPATAKTHSEKTTETPGTATTHTSEAATTHAHARKPTSTIASAKPPRATKRAAAPSAATSTPPVTTPVSATPAPPAAAPPPAPTAVPSTAAPKSTPHPEATPATPPATRSEAASAPAPAAATSSPPATGTTATSPTAAPTATSASNPSSTSTSTSTTDSTTDTTASTGTATPAPNAQPGGRNLIIPVILILIGLGVLILLFRASS